MKISISKSRQELYHFTTVRGLLGIMTTGQIGLEPGWISFTRNKRLNWNCGDAGRVCFVMDWDKMRQKYKGEPFSYNFEDRSKGRVESEERFFGPISIRMAKQVLVDSSAHKALIEGANAAKSNLYAIVNYNKIIESDDWNEHNARIVMGKKWKPGLFEFFYKRYGKDYRPFEWKPLPHQEIQQRKRSAQIIVQSYQRALQSITTGL